MLERQLKDDPMNNIKLTAKILIEKISQPEDLKQNIQTYARLQQSLKLIPDQGLELINIILADLSWSKTIFTNISQLATLVDEYPSLQEKFSKTLLSDKAWFKSAASSGYNVKNSVEYFPEHKHIFTENFIHDSVWLKKSIKYVNNISTFINELPESQEVIMNKLLQDNAVWLAYIIPGICELKKIMPKLPQCRNKISSALINNQDWLAKNTNRLRSFFTLIEIVPEHTEQIIQKLINNDRISVLVDYRNTLVKIANIVPRLQQAVVKSFCKNSKDLQRILIAKTYSEFEDLVKRLPESKVILFESLISVPNVFQNIFSKVNHLVCLYNTFPEHRDQLASSLITKNWIDKSIRVGCDEWYRLAKSCPEYRERLINTLLKDINWAESKIQTISIFIKFTREFPGQKDLLIETLMQNPSWFSWLLKSWYHVNLLIEISPEHNRMIVTTILKHSKQIQESLPDRFKIIDVFKSFPDTQRQELLLVLLENNIFQRVFAEITYLKDFIKKFPILSNTIINSLINDQEWLQKIIGNPDTYYSNFKDLFTAAPGSAFELIHAILFNPKYIKHLIFDIRALYQYLACLPNYKYTIMQFMVIDSDYIKLIMQQVFNYKTSRRETITDFFAGTYNLESALINFNPDPFLGLVIKSLEGSPYKKIFTCTTLAQVETAITQLRKQYIQSAREIRKNARVLAQGTRDAGGLTRTPACFFSMLPPEIGVRIAAMTGDESIYDSSDPERIAWKHYARPDCS